MDVNILGMKTSKALSSSCSSLLTGQLTGEEAESLAAIFRVLGQSARLQMLSAIAVHPQQEVCACELSEPLGLSQPTVSHHLKALHSVGLLARERRGNWIYYRLVPEQFARARQALS